MFAKVVLMIGLLSSMSMLHSHATDIPEEAIASWKDIKQRSVQGTTHTKVTSFQGGKLNQSNLPRVYYRDHDSLAIVG